MTGNFFDYPVNNDIRTYNNIQKFATGLGDVYITGCLLDYPFFKENYMTIAIDLSKKKALGTDRRVMQQINFTENLECTGRTKMLFVFEEVRKTILGFWKRVVKVL